MYVHKNIPLFSQSLSCSFNFKMKTKKLKLFCSWRKRSAFLSPNSNCKQNGHCLRRQIIAHQVKGTVCNKGITNPKVFKYGLFCCFFYSPFSGKLCILK